MHSLSDTMTMTPNDSRLIVCQRCGRGFMLTGVYRDLLERRDARVVTPVQCPTCLLGDGPLLKHRGEVKWFNSRKRYGFITTQEGEDIFFHREQFLGDKGHAPREPDACQTVRFHLHDTRKGPEALNVELVET